MLQHWKKYKNHWEQNIYTIQSELSCSFLSKKYLKKELRNIKAILMVITNKAIAYKFK